MNRKYKMRNSDGAYFVSFATVYWIDVFIREIYFQAIIESLAFCRKEKGMQIYGYCIMPSHIHYSFKLKIKTQPKYCEISKNLRQINSPDGARL
ncbi:transposase [Bibersteinia trehalosi]|uniref:transposase n=1 Tax=Bibersteinia trehalosi TaxID=47735 RepID=UPI0021AB0F2A|nr:transposase [Bibersteinia trehalosi]